jgi:2-iminobutanoate/2-iminopropanoate deaminase
VALKIIETRDAPAAIGPYSQAVQAGSFLFVSGQIGLSPETGEMVSSELDHQARQVLENLKHILTAAGYELSDVVSVDVFLTDMGGFSSFNAIYERVFSTHKPARALVEVSALPRGALVEIKCVACRQ